MVPILTTPFRRRREAPTSRPLQRARDFRRRLGMRAPERRASLSAMATACFRFFTFFPEDERSDFRLYSPITFLTFRRPLLVLRLRAIGALLLGERQLVLHRLHARDAARHLGGLGAGSDGGHLTGERHHPAVGPHVDLLQLGVAVHLALHR